ncbi:homeodomain mating-type protein [Moniliophthora roreri]|nr:homeodomain mating-type protein [Moniliophthora roreri]
MDRVVVTLKSSPRAFWAKTKEHGSESPFVAHVFPWLHYNLPLAWIHHTSWILECPNKSSCQVSLIPAFSLISRTHDLETETEATIDSFIKLYQELIGICRFND